MSPLQINILLHYYTSPTDYPELSFPAQQDALEYFLNAGFLTKTEPGEDISADTRSYTPTEKLHVYCQALCQVPEPTQIWTVDMRKIIPVHTESK